MKERIEGYSRVRVVKPEDSLQQTIFLLIKEMPGVCDAFGVSSIFDLYESQLLWLVAMWNKVEKEKEKQYNKLRKKK